MVLTISGFKYFTFKIGNNKFLENIFPEKISHNFFSEDTTDNIISSLKIIGKLFFQKPVFGAITTLNLASP